MLQKWVVKCQADLETIVPFTDRPIVIVHLELPDR